MKTTKVRPRAHTCTPSALPVPNAFSHREAGRFAVLCVAAGIMSALCSLPCYAQSPQISSVSQISTQQIQTIVISGSGFGTQNPYTGNSAYIALFDVTNGEWQAGNVGSLEGQFENDGVTLIVKSWTDSQIVLGGFSGDWGQNSLGETPSGSWTLRVGDQEQIDVWNAQSGKGVAQITTTVVASSSTTPMVGPPALPTAAAAAYSAQLTASGGTEPYRFAVISGSLPTGLALSSAGLINGTPAQPGTATFTVQVKDAANNTSQLTYELIIGPAAAAPLTFANPSFETPSLGACPTYLGSPQGASWTFVNAGITDTGCLQAGYDAPPGPAGGGNQAAFIQASGNTAILSQTVSGFQAGHTYAVTFYAAGRPRIGGAIQTELNFSVLVGSADVLDVNNAPTSAFQQYITNSFTAVGSATIAFTGTPKPQNPKTPKPRLFQ